MDPKSTIVVGAGMAGLTAARHLAQQGRTVTLLEAAPRTGGRISTVHDGDEVIELGAEFIHGRPPELWSLIEEAGLRTYELGGPTLSWHDGQLTHQDEEDEADSVLDGLEALPGPNAAPDLTFAEYLNRHPNISESARRHAIAYVEGFNAADHRIISSVSLGLQQSAEDRIEGDRLFRLRDGYQSLTNYLEEAFRKAGGTLHLSTLVERIEWSHHHVRVNANHAGQPNLFEAARAIITLPLGVLQHQAVEFRPVPAPVLEAARLRMGQARRFTLAFRERFWSHQNTAAHTPSQPGDFSFLFAFGSMPPVWWTPLPHASRTLTGWVGGPRSEALNHLSPEQLGRRACETLAPIFSLSADHLHSMLVGTYAHDWQNDGLFHGAYSYIPAGALDACSKMTIPVDDTLFFAGEHTDTTAQWGTVHAALRSGLRAAGQVLNSPSTPAL